MVVSATLGIMLAARSHVVQLALPTASGLRGSCLADKIYILGGDVRSHFPPCRPSHLLLPSHTLQAGADALFEDPDRRSTSLGVTVNPVRVPDIAGFGTLQVMPSCGALWAPGER